jgi:hypothetical protein
MSKFTINLARIDIFDCAQVPTTRLIGTNKRKEEGGKKETAL